MRELGTPRTLADLCLLRARTHAERPVVLDDATTVTYAELAARAEVVATRLVSRGVGPGDQVALHGRNSTAWVVAAFGVLLAGGALVPIGHGASRLERAHMVEALGPVLLIHDDDLPGTDVVAAVRLSAITATPDPSTSVPPFRPGSDLASGSGVGPAVGLDPDSPALVLSSSGTTGAVKSVPMTHRQLLRLYTDVGSAMGIKDTDRFLGAVPLAHSFGFNGLLLVAMIIGASVRLMPAYDREQLGAVVGSEPITVLAGPPTIYHDLQHSGVLPHVRIAIAGGQVVAVGELLVVAKALEIAELVIGYGMTETCGTVAIARMEVASAVGPGPDRAAMSPMPEVEIRISANDPVAPSSPPTPIGLGEVGRVAVRGYNVALPTGTRPRPGDDGWFETGDLGLLDDSGRITVVGRSSDLLIVSGFNVHPGDVETVLAAHPDVIQVAVTGIPDRRRGQRLVAFVVTRSPGLDVTELDRFARERLSAYKAPFAYHLVDELPMTNTGKLARSRLRELAVTWAAP